ncbi:MAG TPA: S8 family serine peptidase, partial [bacterium]|nr:S8 family serine peptidase [bacterium]
MLVQTREAMSEAGLHRLLGKQASWKAVTPAPKACVFSVQTQSGESLSSLITHFRNQPEVLYAEPNFIYRLAETTPNDTYFASEQWALRNTGQKGGISGEDIDATEAWDTQTGSPDVVVAVIDTGLALEHSDIRNGTGNVWLNTDEIPGNLLDDDNNGYVDDWRGWNFFEENNNPNDQHSHGTHVSGTIGAIGNNGQGVTGVCWQVKIMPLAAFNPRTGEATNEDLVAAIQYAVNNGAKVINASWGDFVHSQILEDAVRTARDAGVLFVAAVGNNSLLDLEHASFYPAGYQLENIVSVASSNSSARISSFSNQGNYSVDLFAPGESIFNLSLN